jgi:hypothetical protein
MAVKADTWYEGVLGIDGEGQFRVSVWEKDNPSAGVLRVMQRLAPRRTGCSNRSGELAGRSWKFWLQVKSGTLDLDYVREYDDGATGRARG